MKHLISPYLSYMLKGSRLIAGSHKKHLFRISIWTMLLWLLFASCKQKASFHGQISKSHSTHIVDSIYNIAKGYDNLELVHKIADTLIQLGNVTHNPYALTKGYMRMSAYYWNESQHDSAMTFAMKALRLSDSMHYRIVQPTIYAYIANIQKENANYSYAFSAMRKGLSIAEEIKDTGLIITLTKVNAMILNGYAADNNDVKLREQAFKLHEKGLNLARTNARYLSDRMGYYTNMSQYYLWKGDNNKTIAMNDTAVRLALELNDNDVLSYAYNWIGQAYINMGEKEKGFSYLFQALEAAQKTGRNFRRMEIYGHIADNYQDEGDYQSALIYYQKNRDLHDSLQVLKNVRQISQLTEAYEVRQKNIQISNLHKENKQSDIFLLVSLTVLLFILCIAAVLWRLYRKISRRNLQIEQQNTQIYEQSRKLKFLIRELHHRVKNNLQIVSSLLSLQSSRMSDESSKQMIKIGQQRIDAMALIHRNLYQEDNPTLIDLKDYISNLVSLIRDSFGYEENKLTSHINVGIQYLDVDMAMPIGLIINEWVTNSFKYAFPATIFPVLTIELSLNTDILTLRMQDNGSGFDSEKWEKSTSFGHKLIIALTRQLHGKYHLDHQYGARIELTFPIKHSDTSS